MAGGSGLATSEIFDPGAGSSTPTGSMSTDRTGHTATLLSDGNILIAGGTNGGSASQSIELYNTAAATFTAVGSTGNMSTPRTGHTATMLDSGVVLVVGGLDSTSTALASAESYTPSFDPLGTVNVSSSDNSDGIGSSCTLALNGTGATTCTVTDTPAHVGTGTHTITGDYQPAADNLHTASSGHSDLTVTKADQTITFTGAPASAVYNTTFVVTGTASSGLAVTFGASGACSINGDDGHDDQRNRHLLLDGRPGW